MGRVWGKGRREFSCLLFCCPMLAGDSSRTGFGMVGCLPSLGVFTFRIVLDLWSEPTLVSSLIIKQ